jgi:hypothetical protein
MKSSKLLSLILPYAMIMARMDGKPMADPSPITGKRFKPIPKGSKVYFFDQNGNVVGEDDPFVFSCVAIKIENAIKKYKSWKK